MNWKTHSVLSLWIGLMLCMEIASTADVHPRQKRDRALIEAILAADLPGALTALKAGADPNAREATEQPGIISEWPAPTPQSGTHLSALQLALIFAVSTKDTDTLIKALLDAGANADIQDAHHRTPLMLSVRYGDTATFRLLLNHTHRINAKDDQGWTVLHYILREYRPDIVPLLLARGADVNAQDEQGWTPLMRGIWPGYADGIQPLLDRHADVNRRTKDAKTALDIARERKATDYEPLLRKAGAKTGAELDAEKKRGGKR